MCGIVGTLNLTSQHPIDELTLRQMLAMIRHRGPDQFGIYRDQHVGLGNARLSILDLSTGQQPISNEDGTLWIVYNGEVFNYVELRPGLEARGHRFETNTDTEVILHLYEDYGPACLDHLNGQFAFAIWDTRSETLFMARDRVGIRPLYYTVVDGALIFGSEIKAILADPRVEAELDPLALDQIFTYWSTLSPNTIFKNIFDVPPGHFLLARHGEIHLEPYWQLTFPDAPQPARPVDDVVAEFRDLLIDATQIRLRADVPVGAYLSGGLDSSTTSAIIRNYTSNRLDTFSIAFSDPDFDESEYQRQMADFLGTDHQVVYVSHADIGRVFPDVIWHAEAPIMRTSPAPMFLLSKLVNDSRFKVVMTGEGADEFLAGYNIFKEAKIRRFWARQPDSAIRPLILKRLYPYIASLSSGSGAYLTAFFSQYLTDTDRPDYSHALRWHNTGRTRRFFSDGLRHAVLERYAQADSATRAISYPERFMDWAPLHRAQYLEISIFLAQYLLSAQGDRVGMAHSVEGRFPFLDYRVIEFANRAAPNLKLRGLTEKYLLKRVAAEWIPDNIWRRPKRPYRAPIHRSFFNETTPDYVRELLSPGRLAATGLFNAPAVAQLVKKIERGMPISETDDMALVGVLSSQLVHQHFLSDFRMPAPLSAADDVKICVGQGIPKEHDDGFGPHVLEIDPAAETERIVSMMRNTVGKVMRRRGGVMGISGGVDSSVVLALCARAFGPERVVALMLPEKDSESDSERLARTVAAHYGVEPVLEVITPVLDGFGCYQRRDEAIRRVFPEYDAAAGYKAKLVLPSNILEDDTLNVFSLTIVTPDGEEKNKRLPLKEYLQIVAASNFKQRTRMSMLYYHAELRNYAVIGTANKNEHGQGFFVKWGDGGVDIRPIIHLFKTQIYQLAEYLDVPEEVRQRPPTSDTYSAHQTQEEFFFRLPFKTMDLLWYAMEHDVPVGEVAAAMNLTEDQVQRAFNDFQRKQRTTDYLRMSPVELSPAGEGELVGLPD